MDIEELEATAEESRVKDEAQAILAKASLFLQLQTKLQDDLETSGFNPSGEAEEPEIPDNTVHMGDDELEELYDKHLKFYGFLSDQITKCDSFLGAMEARMNAVHGELAKLANEDSSLTNAASRKSWIETHPAYYVAQYDYLYFKYLGKAQEERRRKTSKVMERLHRAKMGRIEGENKERAGGVRKPASPFKKARGGAWKGQS